jgi:hypothetical protein
MPDRPSGGEGHRDGPHERRGEGAKPPRPRGEGPGPQGRRPSRGRRKGPTSHQSGHKPGAIGLTRVAGEDFELVHPRGVRETEPDYEEGLEIWRAGDPEAARDALRYALSACHENLWVHVALGQIALKEFHDPSLAQGHFGYAVELARRALPHQFSGRLPPDRPSNRPFYEALDGLIESLDALRRQGDAASLRALRDRLTRFTPGERA